MVRLIFVLVGFLLGVAVGSLGQTYAPPTVGVLVFVVLLLVAFAWFAGQRDKASAVSVAVARADARAAASAEAQAAAIAQAAVHLHMSAGGGAAVDGAPSSEAPAPVHGRHAAGFPALPAVSSAQAVILPTEHLGAPAG
jgi:hypothetical protein